MAIVAGEGAAASPCRQSGRATPSDRPFGPAVHLAGAVGSSVLSYQSLWRDHATCRRGAVVTPEFNDFAGFPRPPCGAAASRGRPARPTVGCARAPIVRRRGASPDTAKRRGVRRVTVRGPIDPAGSRRDAEPRPRAHGRLGDLPVLRRDPRRRGDGDRRAAPLPRGRRPGHRGPDEHRSRPQSGRPPADLGGSGRPHPHGRGLVSRARLPARASTRAPRTTSPTSWCAS